MDANFVTISGRMASEASFTKGLNPSGDHDRAWCRLVVSRGKGFEGADFIPFSTFGPMARALRDFGCKGKELIVIGKLKARKGYMEVVSQRIILGDDPKPPPTCTCEGSCC